MKLWKNVLVHVDSRESGLEAVEDSLQIAEAFGGRVIAFDAVASSPKMLSFQYPTLTVDHLKEFAVATRSQELRDAVAQLELRAPVEAIVGRGSAGRALLGYAERNADLIVKTASASDVQQRTARGAVAIHLLREAQVPVWLSSPGKSQVNRVIAAVNLWTTEPWRQRLDERVVLAAARLSLVRNAELHVMCVADRVRDELYKCMLRPDQYEQFLARDREELRRSLSELIAQIGPSSVPHLVEGDPVEAIEKTVLDMSADVVVVGRDGIGVGGSADGETFAERLFRRLNHSMLLVPPEPASVGARATPRTYDQDSGALAQEMRTHG